MLTILQKLTHKFSKHKELLCCIAIMLAIGSLAVSNIAGYKKLSSSELSSDEAKKDSKDPCNDFIMASSFLIIAFCIAVFTYINLSDNVIKFKHNSNFSSRSPPQFV